MSKFNVNAIRGFSSLGKEEEIDEPVQRTKLGEGLLNAASKALYADSIYIEYIPRDQIDVNEKNFYTIGDVSSLKESIYTCGLGQPLIVKKLEKGRYRLLSGERRPVSYTHLLSFMFPVGLLYFLVGDLMAGGVPGEKIAFYIVGCVVCIGLILLTTYFQYNATYFATYTESGVRRITLAEQLRKIPLSFFGIKDLADRCV